jgi:hypothetical protein
MTRDPLTNQFPSSALAEILQSATEDPAGRYGARRVPESLKVVEMMGLLQAREWGCCGFNEFRRFLGLKRESLSIPCLFFFFVFFFLFFFFCICICILS